MAADKPEGEWRGGGEPTAPTPTSVQDQLKPAPQQSPQPGHRVRALVAPFRAKASLQMAFLGAAGQLRPSS